MKLHVLHPHPPGPQQENDSSSPRDAELVVIARRIEEARKKGDRGSGTGDRWDASEGDTQKNTRADPRSPNPDPPLPTVVCGDFE